MDESKDAESAPEPAEIKLHLGDRKLERWVEDLKAAPAKLNSLKDAVIDLALKLHETHAGVSDCEVKIGDMDSDLMSTAYELEHLNEQISEQGPEQARLRKATAAMQKQVEQLAEAYAADNEAKDFCQREIAALEEAVGLGAGWTGDQLRKQRDLRRTIEELDVDKERRQQELDQVRRENAAGRDATTRSSAALASTETELAAVREATAKHLALAAEHQANKLVTQANIKDLYAEHERLSALDPETSAAVERGVKDILDVRNSQRDIQRKIDIALKTLEASASAKDVKQREIDEAKLRTRHRRDEIAEIKQAIKEVGAETAETLKEAKQIRKMAAKAESKVGEAESDRAKAETTKDELKAKTTGIEAEVSAAKLTSQQHAREKSALAAQAALLVAQEKDKASAVLVAKQLVDVMHVQERALRLEINGMAKRVAEQRDEVASLEVAIANLAETAEATEHRLEVVTRQLAAADGTSAELGALEAATSSDLKAAQAQHASVVDERRRARAKLNELTEALRAQRDAFAAQAAALEEHKAALTRNTRQRLKVHFDQYLVDKETAAASSKLERTTKFQQSSVGLQASQEAELDRLQALAEAAEKQIKDANRDINLTNQEKDKLSQQLQKTNDEIEAVLVKINTQRRLLDMGRKAYEGCLESRAKAWRAAAKEKAELAKLEPGSNGETANLRLQNGDAASLDASRASQETNIEALPVDQLKAKLMQLNKQLLEEQTRTVALEEEKKRPLNVHRWLALETTDPVAMAAVKRVQSLTKQLVDTAAKLESTESKIEKKKALCGKVQAALIRSGQAVKGPSNALAIAPPDPASAGNGGGNDGAAVQASESVASVGSHGGGGGGGGGNDSVTLLSASSALTPIQDRVAQFGLMLKERTTRLDALSAELSMYQQQVAADGESLQAIDAASAALTAAWIADTKKQRAKQEAANMEAYDAAALEQRQGGGVEGGGGGGGGGRGGINGNGATPSMEGLGSHIGSSSSSSSSSASGGGGGGVIFQNGRMVATDGHGGVLETNSNNGLSGTKLTIPGPDQSM